jgi:hypothetical protein
MIHELKTLPKYFQAVEKGIKTFEIRRNDRNYKCGDVLILKEYSKDVGYTGKEITVKVLYILNEQPFVPPEYVCMSIMEM